MLVLTGLGLSFASARAQILFDNGSTNNAHAYVADTGENDVMTGDVFTATTSGTVTSTIFDGAYLNYTPPTSETFTVSLYSASASGVGSLISTSTLTDSRTALSGDAVSGRQVYEYDGTLADPFTLTAGTNYYFGISETGSSTQGFAVTTSSGGSGTGLYSQTSDGSFPVTGVSQSLAFQLDGTPLTISTPEPSAWGLIFAGLAGLMLVRKVRRHATPVRS